MVLFRTGVGSLLLKEETVEAELERECITAALTGEMKADLLIVLRRSVGLRGFLGLICTEEAVTAEDLEVLKNCVMLAEGFSFSSFFSLAI